MNGADAAPISEIEEQPSKSKTYAMGVLQKEGAMQPVAKAVLPDGEEEDAEEETDEEAIAYNQHLAEIARKRAEAITVKAAPAYEDALQGKPEFSFEVVQPL